ncbi:HNH endonuclease signature motif containing protein [Kaistia sp. MMO-174]|uniref:HNH endonuclease signature motif containing protein n=1 Tax=Kaistia sp. MMO-174 TaxID=3081256 RepID=UPI003FA5A317
MSRTVVTVEVLKELLSYSAESGEFVWRHRDARWFSARRDQAAWNAHFAGKRAGSVNSQGYLEIGIFNKRHRAHLLAWLYENGEWPPSRVDHLNGERSDNRIANLRLAGRVDNARNQGLPSHNTSGVIGVHWMPRVGRWQARIMHEGRRMHLGYFAELQDAAQARALAEEEFGYHPNHGRRPGFRRG